MEPGLIQSTDVNTLSGLEEKNRNGNLKERIRLTKRDIEILVFLLEMKFCSLDELYFKFFRFNLDGSESRSSWWARDRVNALRSLKLISTVHFYTEAKSYYLATRKAFKIVQGHLNGRSICKPTFRLDIRTFEHDKLMTQLRLDLEGRRIVQDWNSERLLSEDPKYKNILSREFRPDAIYLTYQGKKVAFELEISTKAKKRYQDKIKKYVSIMRSQGSDGKLFEAVHYVCAKVSVFDLLINETKIYKDFFKIEMLSNFNLGAIKDSASVKSNQLSLFTNALQIA